MGGFGTEEAQKGTELKTHNEKLPSHSHTVRIENMTPRLPPDWEGGCSRTLEVVEGGAKRGAEALSSGSSDLCAPGSSCGQPGPSLLSTMRMLMVEN